MSSGEIAIAEQAVIGEIILKGDEVLYLAEEHLTADDFESSVCSSIYKAAQEIVKDGKKVDIVFLEERLGAEYRVFILQLAQAAVMMSKNAFINNVKLIADRARERRMLREVERIFLRDYKDTEEAREMLANAIKRLDENFMSPGLAPKDAFLNFMERTDNPVKFIKTGIAKLDKYLLIEKGDMIVVGGRPSAGKTALTLQMAVHMAKTSRVIYFSLETSKEKIYDRIIANITSIPLSEVKKPWEICEGDLQRAIGRYDEFCKLNLKVFNASGWSVNQIASTAVRERADIVFIDYLGIVSEDAKTIYEKATKVSNNIHTMAQKNKITVFALSQLNRDGEGGAKMSSLRDSGAIEQDADAILLIEELPNDSTTRNLKVVKNKEGQRGKLRLRFDGAYQKFYEEEERYG